MANEFLTTRNFDSLPLCDGCGHRLVIRSTVNALETLQVNPLDVVLVSDIGCHGIIEKVMATHTMHGLHGRSAALGAGIAMSLPPRKKVIVFTGDGGATIGLQHLLEAARLNINLTVVVFNNLLYGMTGGQPSGLTLPGYRTVITPGGSKYRPYNLCRLVHEAGAPFASRVMTGKKLSLALMEAIEMQGFGLVEVLESCSERGKKRNPKLRLRDLAQQAGYEFKVWRGEERDAFTLPLSPKKPSLLDHKEAVFVNSESTLDKRYSIVLSGSAGEGIQTAAEIFAQAALSSGLYVTKKGSYPSTVGVGFSTAEIILSQEPILYHDIDQADAILVVSQDGMIHSEDRIKENVGGLIYTDRSLVVPQTRANVKRYGFLGLAGSKYAALLGLLTLAAESGVIPPGNLFRSIQERRSGGKLSEEMLEVCLSTSS